MSIAVQVAAAADIIDVDIIMAVQESKLPIDIAKIGLHTKSKVIISNILVATKIQALLKCLSRQRIIC